MKKNTEMKRKEKKRKRTSWPICITGSEAKSVCM